MRSPLPLRRSRSLALLLLTLASVAACGRMRFIVDAVPAADPLVETTVLEDDRRPLLAATPKIALIDVTGLISDAQRGGPLAPGENPIGVFVEALHRAASDSRVKALIVRINSPGGTVTASDVVYRELMHFKGESRKPVIVLMGDVAASGGFYLARAGDVIIAHPTTITGSIGVVMQTVNISDGLSRIGIHADAITSGKNKVMGSPLQPMSPEHRALLQEMVNEFYTQFVGIVRARRPRLADDQIEMITDGRVVSGARAVELGLVDAVGDLHMAFDAAKDAAHVDRARLVKYHRPIHYVGSAYAATPIPSSSLLELKIGAGFWPETAGFYYLWDPTVW